MNQTFQCEENRKPAPVVGRAALCEQCGAEGIVEETDMGANWHHVFNFCFLFDARNPDEASVLCVRCNLSGLTINYDVRLLSKHQEQRVRARSLLPHVWWHIKRHDERRRDGLEEKSECYTGLFATFKNSNRGEVREAVAILRKKGLISIKFESTKYRISCVEPTLASTFKLLAGFRFALRGEHLQRRIKGVLADLRAFPGSTMSETCMRLRSNDGNASEYKDTVSALVKSGAINFQCGEGDKPTRYWASK